MSKAVELAIKKYPRFAERRVGFICGYEQAEKDLSLTWEDMRLVIDAEGSIYDECGNDSGQVLAKYPTGEDFFGEVLKRYKKLKEDGQE